VLFRSAKWAKTIEDASADSAQASAAALEDLMDTILAKWKYAYVDSGLLLKRKTKEQLDAEFDALLQGKGFNQTTLKVNLTQAVQDWLRFAKFWVEMRDQSGVKGLGDPVLRVVTKDQSGNDCVYLYSKKAMDSLGFGDVYFARAGMLSKLVKRRPHENNMLQLPFKGTHAVSDINPANVPELQFPFDDQQAAAPKGDAKAESTVEEKAEETAEDKREENAEEHAEEKAEEKVAAPKGDAKAESTVEKKAEEKAENQREEKAEENAEENAEEKAANFEDEWARMFRPCATSADENPPDTLEAVVIKMEEENAAYRRQGGECDSTQAPRQLRTTTEEQLDVLEQLTGGLRSVLDSKLR